MSEVDRVIHDFYEKFGYVVTEATESRKGRLERLSEKEKSILTEFVGFLSTHPELYIITELGLLRNQPEFAVGLVSEFIERRKR